MRGWPPSPLPLPWRAPPRAPRPRPRRAAACPLLARGCALGRRREKEAPQRAKRKAVTMGGRKDCHLPLAPHTFCGCSSPGPPPPPPSTPAGDPRGKEQGAVPPQRRCVPLRTGGGRSRRGEERGRGEEGNENATRSRLQEATAGLRLPPPPSSSSSLPAAAPARLRHGHGARHARRPCAGPHAHHVQPLSR